MVVLKQNWKYLLLLVIVTFCVYANALPGEFVYPDDIPGIVTSNRLDNYTDNLRSLHLQTIIFSAFKNVFGANPLPFHLFSLTLHIFAVILAFALIYKIWGEQPARVAALIFAVHPINTEAVSWISGSSYLINAIFLLSSLICYVHFKQTKKTNYLILSLVVYTLALLLTRTPWVLTLPFALIIIDQFILEKRFNWRSLTYLIYFLLPTGLFILYSLEGSIDTRMTGRADGYYINQQALSPVLQSYPFTISSMLRLYVFPLDLKNYYDGNIITSMSYHLMLFISVFYGLAIAYFWKKNTQIAGLMILLIVVLGPCFSPVKITWSMAERYLYLGTVFYGTLIALLLIKMTQGIKKKTFIIVSVPLITLLLSIRTIIRNADYDTPEKLARANVKASPYSDRPYHDLGLIYYQKSNFNQAIKYFGQALKANPRSASSINNIGYIFINHGIPDQVMNSSEYFTNQIDNYQFFLDEGMKFFSHQEIPASMYYLVGAMIKNPQGVEAMNKVADIYMAHGDWQIAKDLYQKSLVVDSRQQKVKIKLKMAADKLKL